MAIQRAMAGEMPLRIHSCPHVLYAARLPYLLGWHRGQIFANVIVGNVR